MPNWCENEITVTGSPDEVAAFAALIGDGTQLLSRFMPTPPELVDRDAPERDPVVAAAHKSKFGAADWYEWNCHNWGVKWDVDLQGIDVEPGVLFARFDSAWGPPTEGIARIAAEHPSLTFGLFYNETGCDFSGTTTWAGGELAGATEGQALHWCTGCERRVPEVIAELGALSDICPDCLLADESHYPSAQVLVCDSHPDVLAALRAHLSALTCANELYAGGTVEALLDDVVGEAVERGGYGARPDFGAVYTLDDMLAARLPLAVSDAPGGGLLVDYTTLPGDNGEVLWGPLAAQYPTATFHLAVTASPDEPPTRFALRSGTHVTL